METKNMSETLKPFYNPGPGDIIKDALEELGYSLEDFTGNDLQTLINFDNR